MIRQTTSAITVVMDSQVSMGGVMTMDEMNHPIVKASIA
jgi:hypothetical protein